VAFQRHLVPGRVPVTSLTLKSHAAAVVEMNLLRTFTLIAAIGLLTNVASYYVLELLSGNIAYWFQSGGLRGVRLVMEPALTQLPLAVFLLVLFRKQKS